MRIEVEAGVRLFVDAEGSGWRAQGPQLVQKPTLILLHGGPGFDHAAFRPFFSRFADQVQLLYVDHRGHGRSDARPPAEWTLDTWADDIVRLCQQLGIERPIVLGQSFGGFVAQRYLARHPDHPAKVVLSSTSHHTGLERKLAAFERLGGPGVAALAKAFWEQPCAATWEPYWAHCRRYYNTTPQDTEAAQRTLMRPEILFHFAGGEKRQMQLLPGLAKVRCPVLVMVGDEDPVTPPQDAEEIAAAIPAAKLVRFPGVGHGPWRDDPEAAERVLRTFLS